ncbi:hypothetical protein C5167_037090 [Papaver somniferum]|uniref:Cathepsin propeptide inhibitor domain-containing protein n=1 Tax=Papaver somniferum TaxID=3469 RepID=A0A4Y7I9R2_PAPSO|nr:uncharacterized protein LOC113327950 [Papaver somniferum]RZC44145.1 hypothetical protein C5167_037090 [Papaver somniferum]
MEAARAKLLRDVLAFARANKSRFPPAIAATARPAATSRPTLGAFPGLFSREPFMFKCPPEAPVTASSLKNALGHAKPHEDLKITDDIANSEAKLHELERNELREDLKVTDYIVNSEAKLHALFLKWLAFNEDTHFDLEDGKAFKERFGIFKETARFINQHNKTGSPTICGLTPFADLTLDEFASRSWKTFSKKPNQVIAGIPEYMDLKAN